MALRCSLTDVLTRLDQLIWLFLAIYALASSCPEGWFGSNCNLKCHCKNFNNCDLAVGTCQDGICAIGWFDVGCQYVDWTPFSDAPSWAADSDESTCNPDNVNTSMIITFEIPQLITRYRLRGIPNSEDEVLAVEILMNTTVQKDPYHQFWGDTVEYIVESQRGPVEQITLRGKGIQSLCSIYITTGRNLAVLQNVSTTSRMDPTDPVSAAYNRLTKEPSRAHYSVDGNRGQDYFHDGCALTASNDTHPKWVLNFDKPVDIIGMTIFNIKSFRPCRQTYQSLESDVCYSTARLWAPFEEGRDRCRQAGGDLAILRTEREWLVVSSGLHFHFRSGCVIGIDDLVKEGTFVWVDGTPLTYDVWAPGSPGHKGPDADCVEVSAGNFFDGDCDRPKQICCSIDPSQRMGHFNITVSDSSSATLYHSSVKLPGIVRYGFYSTLLGVKTVEVIPTRAPFLLQMCEFEAYGEITCPKGRYGVVCEYLCFCARGTCTPYGYCKSGCAPGYLEPTCSGCHRGFFGFPICGNKCSSKCKGNCNSYDGNCMEGCKSGTWGSFCGNKCPADCKSCVAETGECIEEEEEDRFPWIILILIILGLLLLTAATVYIIARKKKKRKPSVASAGPEKMSNVSGGPAEGHVASGGAKSEEIIETVITEVIGSKGSSGKSKPGSVAAETRI